VGSGAEPLSKGYVCVRVSGAAMTTKAGPETLRRENLTKPLDRAQHPLLRQPWPRAAHDEVIDTHESWHKGSSEEIPV